MNHDDHTPGRTDARLNRDRILSVAVTMLRDDPDTTIDEIATAAAVGRATVYRHFESRQRLIAAARALFENETDANERDAMYPAGELGSYGPVLLDVAEVLNKVAPHHLGEQITAEASRLAGGVPVAMYLVDIDGTRLRRLGTPAGFPTEIPLDTGVGPEVPREGLIDLRARVAEHLPDCVVAPMLLRGRAVGVLVAQGGEEEPLLSLGRHGAAALMLAEPYTDVFDAVRRRKDMTAASEIQQNLLPPRIARFAGGQLAGNVLPGYEVGGDWFDYVDNPDGAWIASADASGSGTVAAAIGAVSLGAFRAKRRRGASLGETVRYMEQSLRELTIPGAQCSATIARWHSPSASFFWISCGDHQPLLISPERGVVQLAGAHHPALGCLEPGRRDVSADACHLAQDERVLLISDGVYARRIEGGTLDLTAVAEAVIALGPTPTVGAIVNAVERTVLGASDDPLEDDVTIVAFSPTAR